MVEIRGHPLLSHIVSAYNAAGIKRITVVRGYLPEAIDLPGLNYVDNADYADTGELVSLARALAADPDDGSDLYVSYGDVIFKRYIIDSLAEPVEDFVVVADTDWRESVNRSRAADYVECSEPHSRHAFYREVYLRRCAEDISEPDRHGEWMGFLKVSARAMPRLRTVVEERTALPGSRRAKLHHLLTELVARGEKIRVVYTTGHWLDVDSLADVLAAGTFA
jgi:phosphoenolpyruvate phosphomutase